MVAYDHLARALVRFLGGDCFAALARNRLPLPVREAGLARRGNLPGFIQGESVAAARWSTGNDIVGA